MARVSDFAQRVLSRSSALIGVDRRLFMSSISEITRAQVPAPGELTLDHVAYFVPHIDAASDALERLGFSLTPFSAQSHRLEAGGPVVPAGTGNRCVMLERGYPTGPVHRNHDFFLRYGVYHDPHEIQFTPCRNGDARLSDFAARSNENPLLRSPCHLQQDWLSQTAAPRLVFCMLRNLELAAQPDACGRLTPSPLLATTLSVWLHGCLNLEILSASIGVHRRPIWS
jgi:hypothetical protein